MGNNADGDRLIDCFLNLGELMLRAGAEVNRVEDTIRRIGHAYDFERVEIFTINNMISLTVISPDGRVFGKMGHAERRGDNVAVNIYGRQDMQIFESGVRYFS